MIRLYRERDLEYIIEAHCRIYQEDYNFDESFKEFITDSIGSFRKNRDEEKENIWVVDINGLLKGSIGIVRISDEVAQLRWFLIEADQRGTGQGKNLMKEVIQFSKDKNYKSLILWTNDSLSAARNLYNNFGFKITEIKKHFLSNQEITEEKWELRLLK